jgi:hypothetical protein
VKESRIWAPPRRTSTSIFDALSNLVGRRGKIAAAEAGQTRSEVQRLSPGEFVQNPDGSHSTERSITVTHPKLNGGKPTNIPTIWKIGGKIVELPMSGAGEKQAIAAALRSGEKFQSFRSVDEAVEAAVSRSRAGGRFSDKQQ